MAADMGVEILYIDTDSMHIPEYSLEELAKKFEAEYGHSLIGKKLSQFHTDFDVFEPKFDIDGKRIGHGKGIDCKHIISVDFVALGKKAYLDHLIGIRKDNGEMVQDYHLRMKGVSSSAIWHRLHTRTSRDINDPKYYDLSREPMTFRNPLELYRYLYTGKQLTFDLTCSSTTASFDMRSDLTVESRSEFFRSVSFTRGHQVVM